MDKYKLAEARSVCKQYPPWMGDWRMHGKKPLVDSVRSGWAYDIWELDHDVEVAICKNWRGHGDSGHGRKIQWWHGHGSGSWMGHDDGRIMDDETQVHIGARSHPEVAVNSWWTGSIRSRVEVGKTLLKLGWAHPLTTGGRDTWYGITSRTLHDS